MLRNCEFCGIYKTSQKLCRKCKRKNVINYNDYERRKEKRNKTKH